MNRKRQWTSSHPLNTDISHAYLRGSVSQSSPQSVRFSTLVEVDIIEVCNHHAKLLCAFAEEDADIVVLTLAIDVQQNISPCNVQV